jgi:uncharacterized membrane protein YccC
MSADRFQRIMGLGVLLTLAVIVGVALAPLWVQKVFVVAFTLIFLTGLLTSFRNAYRVVHEVKAEERPVRSGGGFR